MKSRFLFAGLICSLVATSRGQDETAPNGSDLLQSQAPNIPTMAHSIPARPSQDEVREGVVRIGKRGLDSTGFREFLSLYWACVTTPSFPESESRVKDRADLLKVADTLSQEGSDRHKEIVQLLLAELGEIEQWENEPWDPDYLRKLQDGDFDEVDK